MLIPYHVAPWLKAEQQRKSFQICALRGGNTNHRMMWSRHVIRGPLKTDFEIPAARVMRRRLTDSPRDPRYFTG